MDESGRLESGYPGYYRDRGFESLSLHQNTCLFYMGFWDTSMVIRIVIRSFSFVLLLLGVCAALQGMTFDNRYFPLFYKPYIRRPGTCAHVRVQPFFMRAERGIGAVDRTVNLPDINGYFDDVRIGQYDQLAVINGLEQVKLLPANFGARKFKVTSGLFWKRTGVLEAEGISFFYEQYFGVHWSAGLSFFFMHVNARHEFSLDNEYVPCAFGDRQFLFDLRQKLHKYYLGLEPAIFDTIGASDLDLFVRYGNHWEYISKFRSIDVGVKLGVIAPTAPAVSICNPAAVPLGGDKHWGIYLDIEATFELKEDWYFLLLMRGIKRIPRTVRQRIPVGLEPAQYGPVIGDIVRDPGWTVVFNPWLIFEGLREGLGARVGVVAVHHFNDIAFDVDKGRTIQKNMRSNCGACTSWAYEYVTIAAFYDFAKFRDCRRFVPTVSLSWDIPVHWRFSQRSSKTNCVSLIVEADF